MVKRLNKKLVAMYIKKMSSQLIPCKTPFTFEKKKKLIPRGSARQTVKRRNAISIGLDRQKEKRLNSVQASKLRVAQKKKKQASYADQRLNSPELQDMATLQRPASLLLRLVEKQHPLETRQATLDVLLASALLLYRLSLTLLTKPAQ